MRYFYWEIDVFVHSLERYYYSHTNSYNSTMTVIAQDDHITAWAACGWNQNFLTRLLIYVLLILRSEMCFTQRQHSRAQNQFSNSKFHAKQDAWLGTNLGENDSLWRNTRGRRYHVPDGWRREIAEMSVLKQVQVITLASTAVYRHVSDLILMGFPPESLKSHHLLCNFVV